MEPTELVPERLYRLGGSLPIHGDLSWRDDSHRGRWEPFNAYVLIEGDRALLIETGAAAHRGIIRGQLEQLLGDAIGLVGVVGTRIEPDCLSNLTGIATDVGLTGLTVYAAAGMNPLDFFDDLSAQELMSHYGVGVELLRAGMQVECLGAHRPLEVIRPKLRTLSTAWLYDAATQTLFTSDSFSHYSAPTGTAALVADLGDALVTSTPGSADDDPEVLRAMTRRHLIQKFDWLVMADVEPILAEIDEVFGRLDVQVLAPTRGCPIRGSELVSATVANVRAALESLGTTSAARRR